MRLLWLRAFVTGTRESMSQVASQEFELVLCCCVLQGGSDFNPKGKSDAEVMRFCQSFMTELAR